MHDIMLAKEIIDDIMDIVKEKGLSQVNGVSLEIGQIALGHDDLEKHAEDINVDNLKFGLENITKGTILENTIFEIKKVQGENWKIIEIDGE